MFGFLSNNKKYENNKENISCLIFFELPSGLSLYNRKKKMNIFIFQIYFKKWKIIQDNSHTIAHYKFSKMSENVF
jgi:hypothetical protein